MTAFVCGSGGPPVEQMPTDLLIVPCCYGTAEDGDWESCTCWEPVYDADQVDIDPTSEPTTAEQRCHDCAYRPDSPERTGGALLPGPDGPPFWCHQGMRRIVGWRHPPTGRVVPAGTGDYRPPILGATPYRADGTAGIICAGWASQRRVAS
jgi:hypothetical protein